MGAEYGGLSLRTSIQLWRTFVESVMTYAISVWATPAALKKLEQLYHQTAPRLLGLHTYPPLPLLLMETGLPSIQTLYARECFRMIGLIQALPTTHVLNISHTALWESYRWTEPPTRYNHNAAAEAQWWHLFTRHGLQSFRRHVAVQAASTWKHEYNEATNNSQANKCKQAEKESERLCFYTETIHQEEEGATLRKAQYIIIGGHTPGLNIITEHRLQCAPIRAHRGRKNGDAMGERTCIICEDIHGIPEQIENTWHMLLDCPLYETERTTLNDKIMCHLQTTEATFTWDNTQPPTDIKYLMHMGCWC